MSIQIKSLIEKPLTLFVTTTCPFCINARKLASRQGIQPAIVELDQVKDGNKIRSQLKELTKQNTVPYVFSEGEFIGGFSNLSQKPQSFWDTVTSKSK